MGQRILIVDDSDELREVYSLVLDSAGYDVRTASDGEAALKLLRADHYDLVLSDAMMPGVDGFELVRRLTVEEEAPPPVIVNSAFERCREVALACGADLFLRKPVGPEILLDAVASLLRDKRVPAQLVDTHERQRVERQRADAARRRELLATLHSAAPALRNACDGFVTWTQQYFGFGAVVIDLLEDDHLYVVGVHGHPTLHAGDRVDANAVFCSSLVTGGSALLLGDTDHPCFASHPERAAGVRFYAGVPLAIGDLRVGTLCVRDWQPRAFHSEDMRVLERLGRIVSDFLTASVRRPAQLPARPMFAPEDLRMITDAALQRALRRHGTVELALVDLGSNDPAVIDSCIEAVRHSLSERRLALSLFEPNVLALLREPEDGPGQFEAAVDAIRVRDPAFRGAGLVSCSLDADSLISEPELERMAEQARQHAITHGPRHLERRELHVH